MKPTAGGAGGPGPTPASAGQLFPPARLPLVERYADLLATEGVVRGLIGPREVPRLWSRHLLNCALIAAPLPRDASVADVGSGAGLPGLVLALARRDARVTLIEPLQRRTTFLEEVVAQLDLDNVEVRRDRADALHGKATFDVVTARAVAPLERLLGWCMPLVAPRGALLAMKGSSAETEIATARPVLRRLRCAEPAIEELGSTEEPVPGAVDSSESPGMARVVRITWADPARVSWPPSGGRGGARDAGKRTPRKRRSTS